ncbi:PQQ-dependent dehydrogenase, methanol/ethanol family [Flavisphingomonas formosensis]|uniref:PQQ-dependent dehydrogenase, methanol/ethanol family n=1 Tax=Flavisphingomonas formosensis TaxID=861534 RepID=UPI0012FA1603|nr:PQQ-dependent dehydrogenase, methanol/ethanol family [Sphingomonas formosensis]
MRPRGSRIGGLARLAVTSAILLGGLALSQQPGPASPPAPDAQLRDTSDGTDWPGYGRTYGEQHYNPLDAINAGNVARLSLAWSYDLGPGNPASIPVAVDGVLYVSSGLSVVRALDAATGKLLWEHDTRVADVAGDKLRVAWGIRGIAWWDGKLYTGTQDGRLVALDAKTGTEIWSAQTTLPGDGRFITGAPRVFDGKVIIGQGGADSADTRGYVTTYDAATGKQLWRFYIVPGNPADGFEDEAQAMAAKTWTGRWWEHGGGGTAWNAFAYDAETDTVFVGTGNGAPWNQKIRSPGGGDNLFLCSIVALDAKTGRYRWHYQVNPGETWDFNAAMDMHLADLRIAGRMRKVLIQAPKNGFLYVIDRTDGKLISAEKIAKVTWASRIDLATGRPIETPGARFPDGKSFELWPSERGAHSWMPSAFSPKTGLVYIPKLEAGAIYSDRNVDLKNWKRPDHNAPGLGETFDLALKDPLQNTSALLAWDPVTQRKAWSVPTLGGFNGGILATGGNLVFQGEIDGRLSAYAADSGRRLWQFAAQAAVVAAPITYRAGGVQYVTVLVGMGTTAGVDARALGGVRIDARTQMKRILSFRIGGTAALPPPPETPPLAAPADPDYRPDPALATRGGALFNLRCVACHGIDAQAGGTAPDLRSSDVPHSAEAFAAIVRDGALVENGMPRFGELSDAELAGLRQFVRARAAALCTSR